MKYFDEIMNFRHACKIFDKTKKIDNNDLHFILDMARKSPSSFGQEPWRFLVISNSELKAKLKPLCWDQAQIDTSSHLVVILAKIEDVKDLEAEVLRKFAKRGLSKEALEAYINKYATHLKDSFSSNEATFCWSARQCYIALANMMNAAASRSIDSCPIEGFEKDRVEELLGIDTSKYQVSVLLALGYRVKKQSEQLRDSLESMVEFIV